MAEACLEELLLQDADLSAKYAEMGELSQKKLWHQLTDKLLAFCEDASNRRGDNLIKLYQGFIKPVEAKLNPLRLARCVSMVTQQFYPTRPYAAAEISAAMEFVKSFADRRAELGEAAFLLYHLELVQLRIYAGEADVVKVHLEEAKEVLDRLISAEPVLSSKYYGVAAEFYRHQGPASEYYKSALMFLAFTPVETLPEGDRLALARDISLAALVGEGVYNFGEILKNPILGDLGGAGLQWLQDLLQAFNRGDIDAFNSIVAANQEAIEAQQALAASMPTLKQKITLLCVMELVFKRPPHDRVIAFADIAAATKLPGEQVEWLLMKAFSDGLVRGTIDEVAQSVDVSWVQPRVLEPVQIETMLSKVTSWKDRVGETMKFVEGAEVTELFS
eukprot:g6652.t1